MTLWRRAVVDRNPDMMLQIWGLRAEVYLLLMSEVPHRQWHSHVGTGTLQKPKQGYMAKRTGSKPSGSGVRRG